jgi:hypothetical protein
MCEGLKQEQALMGDSKDKELIPQIPPWYQFSFTDLYHAVELFSYFDTTALNSFKIQSEQML